MSSQGGNTRTDKQVTGAWGEAQASLFLSAQAYRIVERNYRVKHGEIDIIAWHHKPQGGNTLCFVEVKTRSTSGGTAERATGRRKLARLTRAATQYCLERGIRIDETPIQFEQVSVYKNNHTGEAVCCWYVIPVE